MTEWIVESVVFTIIVIILLLSFMSSLHFLCINIPISDPCSLAYTFFVLGPELAISSSSLISFNGKW